MHIRIEKVKLLVTAYYIFISLIYAIAALVKHSHYETFGDLAVFSQGIWQYSKFTFPYITLHLNRFWLGDHFHPIMALLSPFYWLFPSEKMLLFIQPFIVLSAIIPLFLIGLKMTKSAIFSFSVVFAYSLYIPLQYAIFYDFHEIIFLPPLFAWAYYFYITNRKLQTCIFLILLLAVKEELGFFVATFGLFILIFDKSWRKFGAIWFVIGVLYSLLMMYIIIPKIGGNYLYFDYGKSGNTPLDVIVNFFKNPLDFIKLFFNSPLKIETLNRTFWPFAYLPVFSPIGFLLSLEQFFSRFIDGRNITRWTIGYHYSAPMAIVTAIGTIWSAHFYSKCIPNSRRIFVLLAIIILLLTRIEQVNASAILLIKKPIFWQRDVWMDYIDKAITFIPKNASVATQNNIASHVTTRKLVYTLSDMEKAEYILVDFHPGQSEYNFFSNSERERYEKIFKDKLLSSNYKIIYQQGDVYLVKKIL